MSEAASSGQCKREDEANSSSSDEHQGTGELVRRKAKADALIPLTKRPMVLIVDDDHMCLTMLKCMMDSMEEKVQVVKARSGEEALKRIDENIEEMGSMAFSHIFCDIIMPSIQGMEVLKRIRESGWPVQVVMMSSNTKLMDDAFDCGADEFFQKPLKATTVTALFEPKQTVARPVVQSILRTRSFGSMLKHRMGGTITKPDLHTMVMAVSIAIILHLNNSHEKPAKYVGYTKVFNEYPGGITLNLSGALVDSTGLPQEVTVEYVYRFLLTIMSCNELHPNVIVQALIYWEQAERYGAVMRVGRWKFSIVACIIIVTKLYYDEAVFNQDFRDNLPMFDLDNLYALEAAMIRLLHWRVNYNQRVFANYFLELQALHNVRCPFKQQGTCPCSDSHGNVDRQNSLAHACGELTIGGGASATRPLLTPW